MWFTPHPVHRSAAALGAGLPVLAPSPEALLEAMETQRMLAGLVTTPEEPYRGAILLRYYQGLAPAEIARLQNVPPVARVIRPPFGRISEATLQPNEADEQAREQTRELGSPLTEQCALNA